MRLIDSEPTHTVVPFREMKIGQVGVIVDKTNSAYVGDTVYKVGSDLVVSLTRDNAYWTGILDVQLYVRLHPLGHRLMFQVER